MKKLSVRPVFLICLLLFAVNDRSGIILMSILAAFLHECGHLLAAKAMHIPMKRMRLDLLGARLDVGEYSIGYGEEWLLAAAGPLASLALATLAYPFWGMSRHAAVFSCASLLLGLLNLLPIRTFDGGRMLESFLSCHFSLKTVNYVLNIISFLSLFLVWAFAIYFLLLSGDGLSLLCFSMSMLVRFLEGENIGGT